jgi:hypothetical protein
MDDLKQELERCEKIIKNYSKPKIIFSYVVSIYIAILGAWQLATSEDSLSRFFGCLMAITSLMALNALINELYYSKRLKAIIDKVISKQ